MFALLVIGVVALQIRATISPWFAAEGGIRLETRADGEKLDPLDVVLIADTSGPSKVIGTEMAEGFQDAIAANAASDDVRLVVRDDEGRVAATSALAQGSASGFHTLAVVGPTEPAGFTAVRDAATDGTVVALAPTASPVRQANGDWTFTLQPPAYKDGFMLGRILQRVAAGPNVVQLVSDKTKHSGFFEGLADSYNDISDTLQFQVVWPEDSDPSQVEALMAGNLYADAILISLPADQAEQALRELRDYGYLGIVAIEGDGTLASFATRFANDPKERLSPGYYTDGVIGMVPFTPNIAGSESQKLIGRSLQQRGRDPSWAYAYGYDTGLVISSFVAEKKRDGTFSLANPSAMQTALKEYLHNVQVDGHDVTGFTGALHFGSGNQRDISPKLIVYLEGKQLPYYMQISDVPEFGRSATVNLGTVNMGQLHYVLSPVVHVGIKLRDITDLNPDAGTFNAAFDVWFKSAQPVRIEDIQFLNAVGDVKVVEASERPVGSQDQGVVSTYRHYALSGKFIFNPTPADLILDQTAISIAWRHRELDAKRLSFVIDPELTSQATAVQADSGQTALRGFTMRSSQLAVEDKTEQALGDPRGRRGIITYSVASFQAELQRSTSGIMSQLFKSLGPDTIRLIFLGCSGVSLLLLFFQTLRPRPSLELLFLASFLAFLVFSEADFFTLQLVSKLGVVALENLHRAYVLVGILTVGRMLDTLFISSLKLGASRRSVQPVILVFVRFGIYAGGASIFYTTVLGKDLLPVLATFSVLLTVIGLALRELIFDAVAGIAISTGHSLEIGQYLTFRARDRNVSGVIEALGWRFVTVRSRDDVVHMVPNSQVATQVLSHMSLRQGFTRLEVPFSMSAHANVAHVLALVTRVVESSVSTMDVVDHARRPKVLVSGLEDDRLGCMVQLFYAADQGTDTVRAVVLRAVHNVLVSQDALYTQTPSLPPHGRLIQATSGG